MTDLAFRYKMNFCAIALIFIIFFCKAIAHPDFDRGTEYYSAVGGFRNYKNDWSSNGGDVKNSRFKPTDVVLHPNTFLTNHTFEMRTSSESVTAPPVFFSNAIVVSTDDGEILAYDRSTGRLIWKADVGIAYYGYYEPGKKSICSSPAIWDRFFLVIGVNYPADFLLINVLNGDLMWTLNLDDCPHSYVSGGGTVFENYFYAGIGSDENMRTKYCANAACDFSGSMVAVNLKEGTLKWKTLNINATTTNNYTDGNFTGCSSMGSTPPVSRGLHAVYGATGDYSTIPSEYELCLIDNQYDDASEICRKEFELTDLCNSVVAYDLETGHVIWSKRFTSQKVWNETCNGTVANVSSDCPESGNADYYRNRMGFDMFPSLSLDCYRLNNSEFENLTNNQTEELKNIKKIYSGYDYFQKYDWEYEHYHPADDYDYIYTSLDDDEKPNYYAGKKKSGDCVICYERLYVAQRNGALFSIVAQNGSLLWVNKSAPGGDAYKHAKGLAIDRNSVYLGVYNTLHDNWTLANGSTIIGGGWIAHNKTNGAVLWTTANPAYYDPTGLPFDSGSNGRSTYSFGSGVPLIWGEHLFVSSADAIFTPNITTGSLKPNANGWLYLLDKNNGLIKSSYQTETPTAASFSANQNCACIGAGNVFRDLSQIGSKNVTCWCV